MLRTPLNRRSSSLLLAVAWITAASLYSSGGVHAQEAFLRGDVNADGRLSVSDFLQYRRWLFEGQTPPSCLDAADYDDNGVHNLTEGVQLSHFLFVSGFTRPPAEPFPAVGVDPTDDDGVGCASYEVVVPTETDDGVRLGDVIASPGGRVRVPVFVTSSQLTEGFQIVVHYNSQIFQPDERVSDSSDTEWFGEVFEDSAYPLDDLVQAYFHLQGGMGVKEDHLVAALIPALTFEPVSLAADEEHLVFHIVGDVDPDAEPGEWELTPSNGDSGAGVGPNQLRNELTHRGEARFVSVEPRQFEPAVMEIVVDQTFFRGDSDDNGSVALTDAVYTLNFLFLGGPRPPCMDAADADDDAEIAISDPILTLTTLFLGGGQLAAPYPERGVDPTDNDAFDCIRQYGSD